MEFDKKPWEIDAELTAERLIWLGSKIHEVRSRALQRYQPEEGDGPWSLGCTIYERTINNIEWAAPGLSWLDVKRENLYFLMLIKGIPIRFYKGEVEKPSSRTLQRHYPELKAQQLVFWESSAWFWRLAIEIDAEGQILRIVVAQFNESGNARNLWEIPLTSAVTTIAPAVSSLRQAVKLNKPFVGIKDRSGEVEVNEKRQ